MFKCIYKNLSLLFYELHNFDKDSLPKEDEFCLLQLKDGSYKLSILKSADAEGTACVRQFFDYPPMPGMGHFIHTYVCDGNPIPTFQGEPERVDILDDIDEYTGVLWNNLNKDNRVSLFVRYTDLESGEYEQLIVNENV